MQAFEKTISSEVSNRIERPSSVFVPETTQAPARTMRFSTSRVQFGPEPWPTSTPSTATPSGMKTDEPSTVFVTSVPSTVMVYSPSGSQRWISPFSSEQMSFVP